MARPRKDDGDPGARRRIVEAYGALALRMPLSAITAADVAREAGCNRTTLYYHFEVFSQVEDAFFEKLFEMAPPETCVEVLEGKRLEPSGLEPFDTMCTLLALNPTSGLHERMHEIAVQRARKALQAAGIQGVQLELRSELAAAGALSVMAHRGKTGNGIEPQELARAVACLLRG